MELPALIEVISNKQRDNKPFKLSLSTKQIMETATALEISAVSTSSKATGAFCSPSASAAMLKPRLQQDSRYRLLVDLPGQVEVEGTIPPYDW